MVGSMRPLLLASRLSLLPSTASLGRCLSSASVPIGGAQVPTPLTAASLTAATYGTQAAALSAPRAADNATASRSFGAALLFAGALGLSITDAHAEAAAAPPTAAGGKDEVVALRELLQESWRQVEQELARADADRPQGSRPVTGQPPVVSASASGSSVQVQVPIRLGADGEAVLRELMAMMRAAGATSVQTMVSNGFKTVNATADTGGAGHMQARVTLPPPRSVASGGGEGQSMVILRKDGPLTPLEQETVGRIVKLANLSGTLYLPAVPPQRRGGGADPSVVWPFDPLAPDAASDGASPAQSEWVDDLEAMAHDMDRVGQIFGSFLGGPLAAHIFRGLSGGGVFGDDDDDGGLPGVFGGAVPGGFPGGAARGRFPGGHPAGDGGAPSYRLSDGAHHQRKPPPAGARGGAAGDNPWGSPEAAAAVRELEAMGAQVYPPGPKEEMDWGVLAGYETQKRVIEDCLMLPLLRPDVFRRVAEATRQKYQSNRPRAMLFEGPPGTGKTTSARVISSQAAVPLIYLPLEAVMSKWYGESEQQLAKVFHAAAALGGAIIFFDELDSLGGSRESAGLHEASRRLLSVMLREMDGFDVEKKTVVIGATNRKVDLDPALLSRFDMVISFGLPDEECRVKILNQFAQQLPAAGLAALATRTAGMSGRDLRDVCEATERRWASKIIRGEVKEDTLPPLAEYIFSADERNAAVKNVQQSSYDQARAQQEAIGRLNNLMGRFTR